MPRRKQTATLRGVNPTGDEWRYRVLITQAIKDAQKRLTMTQVQLAKQVGLKREPMLHARSTRIPEGEIAPINQLSLSKSLKLARFAGWDEEKVWDMASAWLEEHKMRSEPDHIGTLLLLPPKVREERWKELVSLALAELT